MTQCSACDQREDVRLYNKVRDREDALASTRDACAPRKIRARTQRAIVDLVQSPPRHGLAVAS
jgi:hypothetical protein